MLSIPAQTVGDPSKPEKFTFKLGQDDYTVLANGKGQWLQPGNPSVAFSLQADKGTLDKLWFIAWEGDLLLIGQIRKGGEGWGVIMRLDGQFLKPKWVAHVPGSNIGQGLVERGFAYITAIGFAAKLDLAQGKFVWKQDGLYQKKPEAFRYFDTPPRVVDGAVVFRDEKGKFLRVDDETGRVIFKG